MRYLKELGAVHRMEQTGVADILRLVPSAQEFLNSGEVLKE